MKRTAALLTVMIVAFPGCAWAAPSCVQTQDAVAVHMAALQQEMMVAAFMCGDVAAYNNFVLSHQSALQATDKSLLSLFRQANAETGFDDYNFYKTELANASSLRSVRDRQFCARVNADFRAALGRSVEQLLSEAPFPVDTGSVRCPSLTAAAKPAQTPANKPVRHRTWLGRLVDAVFN